MKQKLEDIDGTEFSVNFTTGMKAISNNLPKLVRSIKRARIIRKIIIVASIVIAISSAVLLIITR